MESCLLAKKYSTDIDPTGFHLSEKIDGIRALWDGKNLISRNGNILPSPTWFSEGFPLNIPMDGELFLGRQKFNETSSIVRSGSKDKGWNQIVYLTFDIPHTDAGVVEERWDALRKLVGHVSKPNLQFVPQTVCKGRDHLFQLLDLVTAQGSEGLMLRRPKSHYVRSRSDSLLKVKKFLDGEAIVTGYQESEINTEGKKHLIGSMGALLCNTMDGVPFKVGTGFSDAQRLDPPKIGSMITVKYQELSEDGVPRFPVFVGARDYE